MTVINYIHSSYLEAYNIPYTILYITLSLAESVTLAITCIVTCTVIAFGSLMMIQVSVTPTLNRKISAADFAVEHEKKMTAFKWSFFF